MKIALRKVPDDNGLCQRDFQRKKWFLCILYLLWTSCQCTCLSSCIYVHFCLSLWYIKEFCNLHILCINYLFSFVLSLPLDGFKALHTCQGKNSEKILQYLLTATSNTENYFKEVLLSFWGPSGSNQIRSQKTDLQVLYQVSPTYR